MSSAAHENLAPAVVASLTRQLRQLSTSPPEGVRLCTNDSGSLSEIYAEIDGPVETPYVGGLFKLKLILTEYPAAPPKGYFLSKIFHPNVALSGDICVNTLKRDWTPDTTLSHILQVIRCLLIVPFPESSLNDEAGKLFMEGYDEYFRKAKLWTSIHARGSGAAVAASSSSSSSSASSSAASAAAGSAAGGSAGVGSSISSSAAEGEAASSAVQASGAPGEPLRGAGSAAGNAAAAAPGVVSVGGEKPATSVLPDKRKPAGALVDDKKKKSLRRL